MPMRPDSEDESTVVDREKSQGIAVVESSSVQFSETVSNQLVVYNPGSDHIEDQLTFSNQIDDDGPTPLNHAAPNPKRVLPSVGAFTVQCASCFKWRLIPTKEKYEQIRENISQIAFVCNSAREWRPDVSCDDPPDILQDENRLWAIDKPNIAQPPPGWDRQLRIRGEGSTRFADVYYVAPSGKRLRSMVELQRYLEEHPEYSRQGVKVSQFSFQIPRPLHGNYVRKRTGRPLYSGDKDGSALRRHSEPIEAHPLSWVAPIAVGEEVAESMPTSSLVPSHGRKRVSKEQVRRRTAKKVCNTAGSSTHHLTKPDLENAQSGDNDPYEV